VGHFSFKLDKSSFKRTVISFGFNWISLNFCGIVRSVKRISDQKHAGLKSTYFKFQSLIRHPLLQLDLDLLDELFAGIKRPLFFKAAAARMYGAAICFLWIHLSDVNRKAFFLESKSVEVEKLIQKPSNTDELVVWVFIYSCELLFLFRFRWLNQWDSRIIQELGQVNDLCKLVWLQETCLSLAYVIKFSGLHRKLSSLMVSRKRLKVGQDFTVLKKGDEHQNDTKWV
jgi:hypothetical protein